MSTAPLKADIIVTNNHTGDDGMEVTDVPENAEVNVYDAWTGGNRIGQEVRGINSGPVTTTIANGFGDAPFVYVAIKEEGKRESVRVAIPIHTISATSTLDRISVSWDNSAGYADIKIYLNDVLKAQTGNVSYYEFTNLTQGTLYPIRVELRNPTGDAPEAIIYTIVPTQDQL